MDNLGNYVFRSDLKLNDKAKKRYSPNDFISGMILVQKVPKFVDVLDSIDINLLFNSDLISMFGELTFESIRKAMEFFNFASSENTIEFGKVSISFREYEYTRKTIKSQERLEFEWAKKNYIKNKTKDLKRVLRNAEYILLRSLILRSGEWCIESFAIGYSLGYCIACTNSFDIFEQSTYPGLVSFCCNGYNVCGPCLSKCQTIKMYSKFKNCTFCPSSNGKTPSVHVVSSGVAMLTSQLEECTQCRENHGKTVLVPKNTHNVATMSYSLLPSIYRSENDDFFDELISMYGRRGACVYVGNATCVESAKVFFPVDDNDTNRYVYDRHGVPQYFVLPKNDDMNFDPPYDGATPKIGFFKFISKSEGAPMLEWLVRDEKIKALKKEEYAIHHEILGEYKSELGISKKEYQWHFNGGNCSSMLQDMFRNESMFLKKKKNREINKFKLDDF